MSLQSNMKGQEEPSEMEQRLQSINSALNTVTNLQTQLNGISSQLSMILGNLGSIGTGLTDNIQFLVQENGRLEGTVNTLEMKVSELTPKEESKPKKVTKKKTE